MDVPWPQVALWGPTVIMLGLVLGFLLKVAPTWQAVRFRELDDRAKEINAKIEMAAAWIKFASSLEQLSTTLRDVAVEQRRATETIQLYQRARAATEDELAIQVRILTERVEKVEDHVESQRTATKT